MFRRIANPFGKASANGAAPAEKIDPAKRTVLLAGTNNGTAVAEMRTTWGLLSSFWRSEQKGRAYFYAGSIAGLTLLDVYLGVATAEWSKNILDAFLAHDSMLIAKQAAIFAGISVGFATMFATRNYTEKNLQIMWRGWLTNKFTDAWLSKKAFFHINNSHAIPNPDQRIAEDPGKMTEKLVGLATGAIHSVASLIAFTGVMLNMTGTEPVTVMNMTMQVPSLAFWIGFGSAAACAFAGTVGTGMLGKPLISYNDKLIQKEGDLRTTLSEINANSTGIASYPDQNIERKRVKEEFKELRKNWLRLSFQQAKIMCSSGLVGDASKLAGFGIGGFNYMASKTLTPGSIFQYAGVFDSLRHSMSWIMYVWPTLFEIKTLSNRLTTFADKIEAAQDPSAFYALDSKAANIKVTTEKRDSILIKDLVLKGSSPDHILFSIPDLEIKSGERVIITGASGSGKSLLVQSIYGLWKHGDGEIYVPEKKNTLFAPQVPYVVADTTLRENITYPSNNPKEFSDEQVTAALRMAELDHLIPYLDKKTREGAQWKALSVGEKQRLTFARIFLHKPEIIFLDESTSGLDPKLQDRMYASLTKQLPDATIVSIAHREGVAHHHTRHMDIRNGEFKDKGKPAAPIIPKDIIGLMPPPKPPAPPAPQRAL